MAIYPTPLTPALIESAMQKLTVALLGIDPSSAAANTSVVIGWATKGQPGALITEDVAFIRCIEVDDLVNRTRDVKNIPNPSDTATPPISLLQLTTYMRTWQTFWEVSGPNSFDRTRQIKSGLFTQALHDTFAALNLALYLVTDLEAPRRVPEYRDGEWWERVDFEARFNELVSEIVVVPIAASVEVLIETREGLQDDFTVALQ